jgi:hypothetical protein
MKKVLPFFFFLMVVLASCSQPQTRVTQEQPAKSDTVQIVIPEFNADTAYAFVDKQVSFGPRVCNTPAHEKCADYLIKKMNAYCRNVTIQKGVVKAYNGTMLDFKNIIAAYNPDAAERVMICSHWDSRPVADHDPDPKKRNQAIDGANDGASGVGVLLEIARQLNMKAPGIGIDLILLDAEDYGPPEDKRGENDEDWWALGSQYWARQPHKAGYKAKYGILLDMVGAPNATFLQEVFSLNYASDIVRKVWSKAGEAGYSAYFINDPGPAIDDDHLYINKIMNLPTIDIIHLDKNSETGFYPYWHTTKDNMASIDRKTLKAVGQTLLKVIYEEK